MKILMPILSFVALSSSFMALANSENSNKETSFVCTSADGNQADLTLNDAGSTTQISWSEGWHSAASRGVFAGKDEAPYSVSRGSALFRLVDFFTTADSSYMLALGMPKSSGFDVRVYLDNDDVEEESTGYHCVPRR